MKFLKIPFPLPLRTYPAVVFLLSLFPLLIANLSPAYASTEASASAESETDSREQARKVLSSMFGGKKMPLPPHMGNGTMSFAVSRHRQTAESSAENIAGVRDKDFLKIEEAIEEL